MRGLFPHARARWGARIDERRERRAIAKLSTFPILRSSGRSYLLFRGQVEDVVRFSDGRWYQSPPLRWPDDRSWFVHTETDSTSTHLGGSRALIDELVGEQTLESFEVEPDTVATL
jgi:hypothetical protein